MRLHRLGPIVVLVVVFYMNFLGRWIYSPLLVPLGIDLGLSLGQMGSLFVYVTAGYAGMTLVSGYVARAVHNRGAILTSAFGSALATVIISFATSVWSLRIGLLLLGLVSGLYMPSAMATLTEVAPERHWGKALALHEVAPILALLTAPLLVNVMIATEGWRWVLRLIAAAAFVLSLLVLPWRGVGRTRGQVPDFSRFRAIVADRRYWLILIGFASAIGAEVGTYAVLPTFLTTVRTLPATDVNRIVGFSRLTALAVVLLSGHLRDTLGDRAVLTGALSLTGVLTLLLGILRGRPLVAVVWLQPSIIAAFFPAALAALAGFTPQEGRNVAFSLVFPIAYIVGAGLFPWVMGGLGEKGLFATGFVGIGMVALLAGVAMGVAYRGAQNGKLPSATR